MHNTKAGLRKWLIAIALITYSQSNITARGLASQIDVTKDTALIMIHKIKEAIRNQDVTLKRILEGPFIKILKSAIYGEY